MSIGDRVVIEPADELHCAFAENAPWRPWIGYSCPQPQRIYFPNNRPRRAALAPCEPLAQRRDLARLRHVVVEAEARGKQVHAVGKGWSFSSVGSTSDYLVASLGLDEVLPIEQLHLPASVAHLAVFAQGGCTLEKVIRHIDHPGARPRRALVAFAGCRGMTLAGVVSTGTHGSQPREALIGDAVLALLVVAEGGKLFWVQGARGPVAPGDVPFDGFDGEVISDDAVMNAATLSLGCFGVIYGVLLAVKPMYWFESTRADHVVGGDFAWFAPGPELRSALDDPATELLEVVVNPYPTRRTATGDPAHAVRVTTCRVTSEPALEGTVGAGAPQKLGAWGAGRGTTSADVPGFALMKLLGTIGGGVLRSRLAPRTLPAIMPQAIDTFIENLRSLEPSRWVGCCHDFIGGNPLVRVASCEVSFPRAMTPTVLSTVARWVQASCRQPKPFALPGAVSLRYVAPSSSTLSIFGTRGGGAVYDTCVEISALQLIHGQEHTRLSLLACVDALVALGAIPHWGQLHQPSPATTLARFGAERLDAWRRAYRRLNPTGRTFGSGFARAAGLFE